MEMTYEKLEELRKETKKRDLIVTFVIIGSIILELAIYFFFEINFRFYPGICVIVTVALAVIFGIKANKVRNIYIKGYKDYFVLKSLKSIFTDLVYEPENGIGPEVISSTGMMTTGDRYNSNDYIKGKYKDINFFQSDVHIEEEHQTTDSDGNTQTYYVTIFMGRWFVFDFNKPFKANIEVAQKWFQGNRANTLFGKSKYTKVKMESQEFNKEFKVYAQNEHEAFYILTPSLMEKIQKLSQNSGGKILLCFVDNKLHIGLCNNKDSFEPPSVFSTINETKEIEKVSRDTKVITNFIDELNLDNDLFK